MGARICCLKGQKPKDTAESGPKIKEGTFQNCDHLSPGKNASKGKNSKGSNRQHSLAYLQELERQSSSKNNIYKSSPEFYGNLKEQSADYSFNNQPKHSINNISDIDNKRPFPVANSTELDNWTPGHSAFSAVKLTHSQKVQEEDLQPTSTASAVPERYRGVPSDILRLLREPTNPVESQNLGNDKFVSPKSSKVLKKSFTAGFAINGGDSAKKEKIKKMRKITQNQAANDSSTNFSSNSKIFQKSTSETRPPDASFSEAQSVSVKPKHRPPKKSSSMQNKLDSHISSSKRYRSGSKAEEGTENGKNELQNKVDHYRGVSENDSAIYQLRSETPLQAF